jgi:peptidoglycan LD-endopeptidase CwlK
MTDTNLDDLDDELNSLCQKWLAACQGAGLKVGISQTYRSSAEQDADYAKGRTAPGDIITNARGGESPHNCVDENGDPASCAFDFFIYANDGSGKLDWNAADPQWQKAIAIGESLGLVSGSTFHSIKDNPHFELKGWNS